MKFSIDKIGIDIVWQEDSVYILQKGGGFFLGALYTLPIWLTGACFHKISNI